MALDQHVRRLLDTATVYGCEHPRCPNEGILVHIRVPDEGWHHTYRCPEHRG